MVDRSGATVGYAHTAIKAEEGASHLWPMAQFNEAARREAMLDTATASAQELMVNLQWTALTTAYELVSDSIL
eukprot:SAG11_NODE_621_length_8169_cov_2.866914_10_plen_73_part_00